MSKINLKLIISLARSHNLVFGNIEKNLQKYDLNLSEFGVLELLLHKGAQPVQQIANKILVTSGTITYVIDKLLKKGYVYRRQCDKDKRIYYIDLTEEGLFFITPVFQEHESFLDCLFQDVDDEIKEILVSHLFKISEIEQQETN